MNKLKNLLAKPLITSSTKISPWRYENSDHKEQSKTEEAPTPQPTTTTPSKVLKKSQTFENGNLIPQRKKSSLPAVLRAPPGPLDFDFEKYEELFDSKKIGFKKEKSRGFEEQESPAPRARRHSWAIEDQKRIKHSFELLKKPPIPNLSPNQSAQSNMLLSPLIRSPMNLSKVEESAGLLMDITENIRKDYAIHGLESLEEQKLKQVHSSNDQMSRNEIGEPTLVRKKQDFVGTIEIENHEEDKSTKENREEHLGQGDSPTHDKDGDPDFADNQTTFQRNMLKKLSVKLALTKRFTEAFNKREANEDQLESSQSDLDSLVEENPFEDETTVRVRANPLRKMKTRLRDDARYKNISGVLFPDDPLRKVWDLIISLALLYTAMVMPVRLTFIPDDDANVWPSIDWSIDGIFALDIFFNFFSAYFDGDENLIFQRKKIIKNYLSGWFLIDLLSILPFHLLSDIQDDKQRLNNLVRVARLPRLYKLVKIVKLVRMIKIIKDKDKFTTYMNSILKLTAAYERLLIGVLGVLLFCHITACIWFLLVDLGDSLEDWLSNNDLEDVPKFDQYIASFYFIVQTMVTVGYGDLSPKTKEERLLTCFVMIIGVLFYSIFIGFVSSLINDMEMMNQRFNQKLHTLYRLKKEYSLPVTFMKKLRTAIKYENKQTQDAQHFIADLPVQLGIELACIMHKEITDSIAFFQNRPKAFIASICPLLKPIAINKGEIIFMEGDPADEIFFIKSGTIGFVLPNFKNECFLKIRAGYFFGEIDLLFYGEIRKYTAIALRDCELYVLNKKDFKQVFLIQHRDIGTALFENAYKRKQRTRKTFKEALEVCKNRQANGDKDKNTKLRLSFSRKDRHDDTSSDDSHDSEKRLNPLMGIVEEEEEDEEDVVKKIEEEGLIDKNRGHINPMARLKAALRFKRAIAPKSSLIEAFAPEKEEIKFGELNRKIDGLESKIAKLATLGQHIKAYSSRDLFKGSPDHGSEKFQKSGLGVLRTAQTPSNKVMSPRIPIDSKVGIESRGSETFVATPTSGTDSPLNSFRSPNALRRNVLLKKPNSENPATFKAFASVRQLGLSLASQGPETESDRIHTPSARNTNKDTYGDFRTDDPMINTDHHYELKEEEEIHERSSHEEKSLEKSKGVIDKQEKEEENKKANKASLYKLFFDVNKRKESESKEKLNKSSSPQRIKSSSKENEGINVEDF